MGNERGRMDRKRWEEGEVEKVMEMKREGELRRKSRHSGTGNGRKCDEERGMMKNS
jgi:hypothetical protein